MALHGLRRRIASDRSNANVAGFRVGHDIKVGGKGLGKQEQLNGIDNTTVIVQPRQR